MSERRDTHQLILVGGHRDEDVLREDERAIEFVFKVGYLGVRAILTHDQVNARLVAMH